MFFLVISIFSVSADEVGDDALAPYARKRLRRGGVREMMRTYLCLSISPAEEDYGCGAHREGCA